MQDIKSATAENEERGIKNELAIKKLNNQMKNFGELMNKHETEDIIKSLELEIYPSIENKIMVEVKSSFREAL